MAFKNNNHLSATVPLFQPRKLIKPFVTKKSFHIILMIHIFFFLKILWLFKLNVFRVSHRRSSVNGLWQDAVVLYLDFHSPSTKF